MNRCIRLIPRKVPQEHARTLEQDIRIEEINEAIGALANDKYLGIDGLSAEFYKKNKDQISSELLEVYEEAFEFGSLGNNINIGLIKLLPKDGDKSQVKNWRPITLLNISYKIIAKILARRIRDILKEVVLVTQIGFIKGRYILYNLITSWEAMNWAKDDKQNAAMVLLDFEKAYDRIEWPFVVNMLEAFGFPKVLCKWVNILFKDSSIVIDVNGELSECIPLGRSIRQGCPLAPALYVIVVDALSFILKVPNLGQPVKGICLPNEENLLIEQFVDDTTLFLEMEE